MQIMLPTWSCLRVEVIFILEKSVKFVKTNEEKHMIVWGSQAQKTIYASISLGDRRLEIMKAFACLGSLLTNGNILEEEIQKGFVLDSRAYKWRLVHTVQWFSEPLKSLNMFKALLRTLFHISLTRFVYNNNHRFVKCANSWRVTFDWGSTQLLQRLW